MDRGAALTVTLLTGALVAFQPPANASLARHVGDLGAALTSLVLSLAIVAVLMVVLGDVGGLRGLDEFRPEHLLGGVAGAAIVVVSLITVRSLGVAGVTAVLVAAQLVTAAVIDRLGLFAVYEAPLTTVRVLGIALLVAGAVLVTSR